MMKKNFISRGWQWNEYGAQLSPVATGGSGGLSLPKRSSKSPQIESETLQISWFFVKF